MVERFPHKIFTLNFYLRVLPWIFPLLGNEAKEINLNMDVIMRLIKESEY